MWSVCCQHNDKIIGNSKCGPKSGINSKTIKDQPKETNKQYCLFPGIIINISLCVDFVVSFKHHVTGEEWQANDYVLYISASRDR